MNQLFVQTSKIPKYALIVLSILFVPAAIWLIGSSLAGGITIVPLGLGLFLVGILAFTAWISRRGQSRSVDVFSDEGLRTNSGSHHSWADLKRVVDKMTLDSGTGRRKLWRTEIHFNDGSTAWLIPLRVKNYADVRSYIQGLKCEHIQEDV